MTGGSFLNPHRMALLTKMYGPRAGAVAAVLGDFKMPVGQTDPVLADLYANSDPLRQASLDYLVKRHGVPPLALAHDADGEGIALAEAMVEIDGGGFEFSLPPHSDEAVRAIIIVARDEGGDPLDLLSWAPRSDRVATYRGRAAILGAHELAFAHIDEPLRAHRSMLSWLQAGRSGVVVLDPKRAWRLMVDELIGAADVEHGLELRRMLQPPLPRIVIPGVREAA